MQRPLVLGSSSPRRQYLMKEAGLNFTVRKPDVDEEFPAKMPVEQVAIHLASKKADYFARSISNEIIVTADTVVILDDIILNKPFDHEDACRMLASLSGRSHRVMTGVCILTREEKKCFDTTTMVTFNPLSSKAIEEYVDRFKPFDKAGAYGAQDCLAPNIDPSSDEEKSFLRKINRPDLVARTTAHAGSGIVAIHKIEGSYFNVMGLPIHQLYDNLQRWL